MSRPEREAERWLRAAREDLAYAQHAAEGGFHAPACFHAQQAAEKAVKSLHYRRGARVVMGHNVRQLIKSLDPPIPELESYLDEARDLDLFYITSRYPNGLDSGTPAEAFSTSQSARALEAVAQLLSAVEAAE